jgi:stalled ribosome rescue protein Dom34
MKRFVSSRVIIMAIRYAAVWIDQHEAKVFHVTADAFDSSTVHSAAAHVRRHPKGGAEAHEHPIDAKHFYDEVARALTDVSEILVVGPAKAKLEFVKHVHKHIHALEPKIVGVETVDHPTDAQLAAYVRTYFKADRTR